MSQQIIRIINTNETPIGFAVKRFVDGYFLQNLSGTFASGNTLGSPFPLTQLSGYKSTVFRYVLDTTNFLQGDYIIYIIDTKTLQIEDIVGVTI